MTAQDRFADQWATVDQVADALKRLEEDAGALYETTILGQLKKMRAKDPLPLPGCAPRSRTPRC